MNNRRDTLIITGGNKLQGETEVSGAKNVALKALVAACLTEETVTIDNIPLISDFFVMRDIIVELGGTVAITDHTAEIQMHTFRKHEISLENAARTRTSAMFLAPLLYRCKKAIIPNPGGCRLGARPIDRTIEGLRTMGAVIDYDSEDGYFHATIDDRLQATEYHFDKNTHTGTETLIIAAVLAQGKTILHNAGEEPEIDDLIHLLNAMGATIVRTEPRIIEINGVEKLHGARFTISPDRNEIVTIAIAAIVTGGDVLIRDVKEQDVKEFLEKLKDVNAGVEVRDNGIRFYSKGPLVATDVTTSIYPGFMTDWQAPWAVLMTQADGVSTIHETVFENRFSYVKELKKMGAHIDMFNPSIENPREVYNFNPEDDKDEYFHAIRIHGPSKLHNAVVSVSDLRAGATLVLGALAAKGQSIIFGVSSLDRGYEKLDVRLSKLGASIKREKE